MPELPLDPSDFAAYYRFSPAALAIRECVRLAAVRKFELQEPILDVGCGDGLFARLAFPEKQTWGIDINPTEVQRAQQTKSYSTLICGNICDVDLPQRFFGSSIANCSLEHVPDIKTALVTIRRSLQLDGRFIMIVPTPDWDQQLLLPTVLKRVGMPVLARAYGDGLNGVFSHIHLYEEARWREILDEAGFEVEHCEPVAKRDTSWAFDLMMYPSLLGYITKKVTGRWVLSPGARSLSVDFSRRLIDAIGRAVKDDGGAAEYLFVCSLRG